MKTILTIFILATFLFFTGCGGSGGGAAGDSTPPETSLSGEVIYGPTLGIFYVCSSGKTGTTDSLANFSCNIGDNVSFYLESVLIATLDAESGITTPYEFFPNNTVAALNFARLLQALDGDGDTSYGPIVIDPSIAALIPTNTDFTSPSFETDIEAALGVSLIALTEAQDNLNTAIIAAGGVIPPGSNIPVANAGADQSFASVNVTLDGTASSDLDGDVLTYAWSTISRPLGSLVSLSSTTVVNPSFTADVTGDYIFELSVSDGISTSPSDQVTITTTGGNFTPISNAGTDQNIPTSSHVTLDGSSSFDANGDTLNYNWTLVSKPATSTAVLSSSTIVNPSFTADVDGSYTFELTVDDTVLFSATDSVLIIAVTGNSAPVAYAGIDQGVPTTSLVSLDGSASSDSDGDGLTYSWSVVNNPIGTTVSLSDPTAVNPYFTAYLDGEYVLELIVNDGTVNSAADSVSIIANTANSAPVANAGVDQNIPTTSLVILDGSASSDRDGDGITYFWSVSGQPSGSTIALSNATLVNPSFTADLDGTYTLQLVVNDGNLNSSVDAVSITSSTDNSAPVANAGADASTYTNVALALDGSASSDANGDTLSFAWIISSEPVGSLTASFSDPALESPNFTPDVSGSYVLQLIVNDGAVDSALDSVTITVLNEQTIKTTGLTTPYILGDDGNYQSGATPDYTLGTDIVIDNVTGLMWENSATVNNDDLSAAINYCSSLNLGGFSSGWRLPTATELLMIADRGQSPAIDTGVFVGIDSNPLWSSTLVDESGIFLVTYEYVTVDFTFADSASDSDSRTKDIRCVRGSTNNATLTRDAGNGVVQDSENNLIWQDDLNPGTKSWTAAIDYCESLTLNSSSQWRLPNVNELLSVIDFTNPNGIYKGDFLYNSDGAWSSTTVESKITNAMSVYIPSSFTLFFFSSSDDWPTVSSDEAKTESIELKCVMDMP